MDTASVFSRRFTRSAHSAIKRALEERNTVPSAEIAVALGLTEDAAVLVRELVRRNLNQSYRLVKRGGIALVEVEEVPSAPPEASQEEDIHTAETIPPPASADDLDDGLDDAETVAA